MLFRTHLVFGIFFFFVLDHVLLIPNRILFFIFMMLAVGFVDIDSRKSTFGKNWYLRPVQWITKHRGMIHSLFFALFLSVIIASVHSWLGIGFFAGYVSHLLLDMLTKSGVAVFWPISGKRFGFGIKSGGIIEQIIFVLLLLLDIFIVGRYFLNFSF